VKDQETKKAAKVQQRAVEPQREIDYFFIKLTIDDFHLNIIGLQLI
jgi:hypothetical protein